MVFQKDIYVKGLFKFFLIFDKYLIFEMPSLFTMLMHFLLPIILRKVIFIDFF